MKGRVGELVRLECDSGNGRTRASAIPLEVPQGVPTSIPNLSPLWVRTDTRELSGGIGYFALSAFINPVHVMGEFGKAIERFRNAPGLVIDLRGNEGGAYAQARLAADLLFRPGVFARRKGGDDGPDAGGRDSG